MIVDIPSLKKHLLLGRIDANEMLPILSVIRVELEKKNLQEHYQFLNMFCNWCAHPKLSGTMLSIDIIQKFVTALIDYDKGKNSIDEFNKHIIDTFFSELNRFFETNDITSFPFYENNLFLELFIWVLNIIKNRELMIPEHKYLEKNETRKQRYQMFLNVCNSFLVHNGKPMTPSKLHIIQDQDGNLRWQLDTLEYISFTIPIVYNKIMFRIPK